MGQSLQPMLWLIKIFRNNAWQEECLHKFQKKMFYGNKTAIGFRN